ncbi:carboxymuconolactone decarboxylase family protein [Nocardia terpenica]|uniref:Carboxymuconolactone decarboxylase-like domain-containing protein n=1 Tax=Nocardia terpenica TaxID=455432 RepID=A0A164LKD6_9NOCA|nr:carboxymuconolactone decarboxylase family protein [Nocardia terpenica]KZM72503.1 hypothetical protein AWN90_27215 [Nocardia terpenica]NQE92628.1 carboxymuconolactone decarboxylase family protein [Nocardia terpenica]
MSPRIEPLPPQRWSEAARRTYAEAMKTPVLGELSDRPTLAVVSTLAANDWLFAVSMPFLASISGGRIPARERELMVLRIAYLARSQYMWSHHCALAADAGVTADEIDRIARGPRAPGWSADEAALLAAADELHERAELDASTWRRLATRFGEPQVLELLCLAGAFRMLASVLTSCRVELDDWREPRPFPAGSDPDEDHGHHGDQDQPEETQVAEGVHPIGNAPG